MRIGLVGALGFVAVTLVPSWAEEFRFRSGPDDEVGRWIEGELLEEDAAGNLRIRGRFGTVVSRARHDLLERRPDLEQRLEALDPSVSGGYLDLATDVLAGLGRSGRSSAELETLIERLVRIAVQLEEGRYREGCRLLAGRWQDGERVGGLSGPDRALHYADRLLVAFPEESGVFDLVKALSSELAGPRSELEALLADLPPLLGPSRREALRQRLLRWIDPHRGNLEAIGRAVSHDADLSVLVDRLLRGICLPCDLTGRVRCSPCRGEGATLVRCTGCPVDRGRFLQTCTSCEGTGRETDDSPRARPKPCRECGGRPRTWVDCPRCGDDSPRGRERIDCSACRGAGRSRCSLCGGDGWRGDPLDVDSGVLRRLLAGRSSPSDRSPSDPIVPLGTRLPFGPAIEEIVYRDGRWIFLHPGRDGEGEERK